jgi:hypothetical protein
MRLEPAYLALIVLSVVETRLRGTGSRCVERDDLDGWFGPNLLDGICDFEFVHGESPIFFSFMVSLLCCYRYGQAARQPNAIARLSRSDAVGDD